ncbi:MAG: hypothetical protein AAF394_16300, partial [Planctomycetota bacterium]
MTNTDFLDHEHDEVLSSQAAAGDQKALGVLLQKHRERLKKMLVLKMPPQLLGRVDGSDIIQ